MKTTPNAAAKRLVVVTDADALRREEAKPVKRDGLIGHRSLEDGTDRLEFQSGRVEYWREQRLVKLIRSSR